MSVSKMLMQKNLSISLDEILVSSLSEIQLQDSHKNFNFTIFEDLVHSAISMMKITEQFSKKMSSW